MHLGLRHRACMATESMIELRVGEQLTPSETKAAEIRGRVRPVMGSNPTFTDTLMKTCEAK